MTDHNETIRLTQYSHGAGCGCKIAPAVLDEILANNPFNQTSDSLLVGNDSRDDAAVYDIGEGTAIISTTDFFMPIVDDAFDFGRIAATNAISDIYAMGGKPLMAIAILGWPIDKLSTKVARDVINGARHVCQEAGISLAGGHSIDAPEPIFGLAVTGQVKVEQLKRNNSAKNGDKLYLTKPLGIGILTTAEKKNLLKNEHKNLARDVMCQLNSIGSKLAQLTSVNAMTDVTGFGLFGHLTEICAGSDLSAQVNTKAVPLLDSVTEYLELGAIPGGTQRNFESYGHQLAAMSEQEKLLFCDPQTSGGLLVTVSPDGVEEVEALLKQHSMAVHCIGELQDKNSDDTLITVLAS